MESEKTIRMVLLCGVILILGLFFFLFKVEACKSGPASCKEEFIPFESRYNPICSVGATAEMVTSPPAPKSGIICHCPKTPEVK